MAADGGIVVESETIAFVREVHACSLLLINAGADRTQQEFALRTIVEACNNELVRRGIDSSPGKKV